MTDKLREAAQAALAAMSVVRVFVTTEEKIKHPEGTDWYDNIRINLDDSIVNDIKEMNALEAALAEPEQEPVAWTTMPEAEDWCFVSCSKDPTGKLEGKWFPLYAAPPRREWVGLTAEDMSDAHNSTSGDVMMRLAGFARAIEAKLKEKNT